MARQFAVNARACLETIADYCRRYAQAARELSQEVDCPSAQPRLQRIADALSVVPMQPATDLFSALQSIWMIHFVTSCIIGARDFGFGHLDHYLLPNLEADLARGAMDQNSATDLLAHFLLKSNEITGSATWNYQSKPTPSQASKQYVMLGGNGFNQLSEMIVEAAERILMPQPTLTFQLSQAGANVLTLLLILSISSWLLMRTVGILVKIFPYFIYKMF